MSTDNPQSLDDVFNGVQPELVEEIPEVEVEAKVEEQTPVQDAPTASKEPESENWTKAMALDERRKRQDVERKLEERERRLAELEALSSGGKKAAPDVFEDQDGFNNHIQSTIQSETLRIKIEMSQELMREKYPEYDELELEFVDLAKNDSSLWAKMQSSAMPAKFVVETVKNAEKLKQMENIDEWRAQERERLRQELLAEMSGKKPEVDDAKPTIRPSLANARSTGKASDETLDRALSDIFGR